MSWPTLYLQTHHNTPQLSASTKVWTLGNTTKTRESDQGTSRETIAGILVKLKADLLEITLRPIYYTTGTWKRAE